MSYVGEWKTIDMFVQQLICSYCISSTSSINRFLFSFYRSSFFRSLPFYFFRSTRGLYLLIYSLFWTILYQLPINTADCVGLYSRFEWSFLVSFKNWIHWIVNFLLVSFNFSECIMICVVSCCIISLFIILPYNRKM